MHFNPLLINNLFDLELVVNSSPIQERVQQNSQVQLLTDYYSMSPFLLDYHIDSELYSFRFYSFKFLTVQISKSHKNLFNEINFFFLVIKSPEEN